MSSERKRVLVLAEPSQDLVARLAERCEVVLRPRGVRSEEELAAAIPGFHGLFTLLLTRVGEGALAAADRLEIVANCAVGVDNIDLEATRRHGVIVTNTPGVLTDDTADLALALLLAVARRVIAADSFVRQGRFQGWDPELFLGHSVSRMTVGVVGTGRIGQALLARLRGLARRRLYSSRRPLPAEREVELGAEWRPLDELLAESDAVSLHVSLTAETRHLLDRERLGRMKPGAILINTSRGPVVDEAALVEVLSEGHLGGAGLDVYEREPEVHPGLLRLPEVVLLPHIGSATHETRYRMAEMCVEDLLTVLADGRRPERAL